MNTNDLMARMRPLESDLVSDRELKKREWYYLQPPSVFNVAPCECGNVDLQWSEFEGHCWCAVCQKDFKPIHNGLFDGPIPMQLVHDMGIRFDRRFMKDGRCEHYDICTRKYVPEIIHCGSN